MARAATHHHFLLALPHVFHHRLLGIELIAILVKIGHFQLGTALDHTTAGLELAEQQLDQRRLAATVGAHQRNLVAAQHLQIQPLEQGTIAKVQPQTFGLEHQLAGAIHIVHLQLGLALQLTALTTLHPHRLEGAHPAFVTGAACLDALADPYLFLGQLAIELGVFQLLDPQPLLFTQQVLIVVAGPGGDLAAIEIDDPGRQLVDELPIVRDEDDGATEIFQELFQPVDGFDVQVVGRLIEQQQIRIAGQGAGQGHLAQPATGQAVEGRIGIEVEQGQHLADAGL
ncbi:hypothetical protein D3C79_643490 [compost metagenome]